MFDGMEPPARKPKRESKRKTRYSGADGKPQIELIPRNENQKLYIEALQTGDLVIATGSAGTGKTYVSATHAANLYQQKTIDKIVITRPHVPLGQDIGFLPGDLYEKTAPWALPVLDVFIRHLGKGVVETAIKSGNIEIVPLALMRGRSFDDCVALCDETQNMTVHELKALLTRAGENCQIVLSGDVEQTDLAEQSGLSKIVHMAKKYGIGRVVEFDDKDIVRSNLCRQWIKAFKSEGL